VNRDGRKDKRQPCKETPEASLSLPAHARELIPFPLFQYLMLGNMLK